MATSYHFSVGNSTHGHIGLCARVTAETEGDALKKLLEGLPDSFLIPVDRRNGVEYIEVYLNTERFSIADIDESDPEENMQ